MWYEQNVDMCSYHVGVQKQETCNPSWTKAFELNFCWTIISRSIHDEGFPIVLQTERNSLEYREWSSRIIKSGLKKPDGDPRESYSACLMMNNSDPAYPGILRRTNGRDETPFCFVSSLQLMSKSQTTLSSHVTTEKSDKVDIDHFKISNSKLRIFEFKN